MRVVVPGCTGSYIIPELIGAGHEVTALARSETAAATVAALGQRSAAATSRIPPLSGGGCELGPRDPRRPPA